MKDLIERLRSHATPFAHEAADALERLEAENAQLKAELAAMGEPFATMRFNENGGATFSGIPAGTVLKAGDVFTLYAASGATND